MPRAQGIDIRFSYKRNPKLQRDVKEKSRKRLNTIAQRVQKQAKQNLSIPGLGKPAPAGQSPRLQGGDLQRSIAIRKLRDRKDSVGVVVFARQPYGIIHEEGLGRYPKRPWLRPAFQKVTANLSSFFKNLL